MAVWGGKSETFTTFCRRLEPTLMRILFITVGLLSLGLGIIGLFLPLLPTVPFVLLSAACFSRSSKRMHGYLLRLPFAGKAIDDYEKGRGVSRRAKVTALLMLWSGMTISMIAVAPPLPWLALMALVAIGATIVIVRLPKQRREAE